MPKLFCDANPNMVAYYLEYGGSGYQSLQTPATSMEAEYLAIMYGLNEYFLKWNKELDSRFSDLDPETKNIVDNVMNPSAYTKRPLPPPVMVCSDNEVVVKQLSRQYHIGSDRLRKLAMQVWQMCQNVDVKFQWIPRKENLAGNILK